MSGTPFRPPVIYDKVLPTNHESSSFTNQDHDNDDNDFQGDADTELKTLATNPQLAPRLPDLNATAQVAQAAQAAIKADATQIQAVSHAQHQMNSFENSIPVTSPGTATVPPGPLYGNINACNRARAICIWMTVGMLGGAWQLAAIFIPLKQAGLLDAAKSISDPTGSNNQLSVTKPTKDQLNDWYLYPDPGFFNLMRIKATEKGKEWSGSIFSYVVEYLSAVFDSTYDPNKNPAYKAMLVAQSVLDTDYAKWKTGGFIPIEIFDVSAMYPTLNNVTQADLDKFGRGARLQYLKRQFSRAILDAMTGAT